MILLSAIISRFKDRYLATYKHAILPGHRRALEALEYCRHQHGPHMLAQCPEKQCRHVLYIPHSCGHRFCPHCQSHESQQWIDNQRAKLLPAPYYLVTFTLPRQLRDLAYKNQRRVYACMFQAVKELLKTFTRNDTKLGGDAGFTAILHTHARNLDFHPHIHVIIPAAAINRTTMRWRVKSGKYLFNHTALAQVFRAKFLLALSRKNLCPPLSSPQQWVVDCKHVGTGEKALVYLGRYLYRGVIREQDILHYTDATVTYRYFHAKTKKYRTKTVAGEQFLALLMRHFLPKGFRRTRDYGFLNPCSKKLIRLVQLVLRVPGYKLLPTLKKRPPILCPRCGAPMKIIMTMLPQPPPENTLCLA
jgi:hypothetical protein